MLDGMADEISASVVVVKEVEMPKGRYICSGRGGQGELQERQSSWGSGGSAEIRAPLGQDDTSPRICNELGLWGERVLLCIAGFVERHA